MPLKFKRSDAEPLIDVASEDEEKLQTLVDKWSKIFKLHYLDELYVTFVPSDTVSGNCAYTYLSPEYRQAHVYIAPTEFLRDNGYDLEETLIHEFLHIVLQGHLAELPAYDPQFEYGINLLSQVLASSHGKVE